MIRPEQVRELFEQREIRRVKIGGFDVDGILRGKYVSLEKLWSILDGGMGFCDVVFGWDSCDQLYDRPTITGWHTGYPDTHATIDLDTLRFIPWEPNTAAFLLDFSEANGDPLAASPRQLLRRVLSHAEAKGLTAKVAIEFEFFIYDESPWSLQDKGFTNLRTLDPGMFGYSWMRTGQFDELVHEIMDTCDAFDCSLEGFHTETGPGVFEAAIRYDDALRAADKAALFKTLTKEICHRHGKVATFMAKPENGLPGCSGHVHQSFYCSDENIFYDATSETGVSETCLHYLAGQVATMPELCALLAPNVNSFKRLLDGNWAPNAATWGYENRTCALRVIPGNDKSTRIEHRLPGADLNPYTAVATMIAAGLHGIENRLTPPLPIVGNAYEADAAPLPTSLARATDALRESNLARDLLGEGFLNHYLVTRDWEVRQSERMVMDWERSRYFESA